MLVLFFFFFSLGLKRREEKRSEVRVAQAPSLWSKARKIRYRLSPKTKNDNKDPKAITLRSYPRPKRRKPKNRRRVRPHLSLSLPLALRGASPPRRLRPHPPTTTGIRLQWFHISPSSSSTVPATQPSTNSLNPLPFQLQTPLTPSILGSDLPLGSRTPSI